MQFPKMIRVKQHFAGPLVDNIEKTVGKQLSVAGVAGKITPGMKIAVTAGSRGVANIAQITRATINQLKEWGAEPYIIPAMGSHGGATAAGQAGVLQSLGITEQYCGAPILSSMEVAQIGKTPQGLPVYCDKHALSLDGIVLIGRIKVHTDFKSPIGIESGLMKMAAIGLGKHKQALLIHSYGVPGIRDLMPEVAKVVLQQTNVICGIGIVENAFEQTAIIEAIPSERIYEREKALLLESAALMPKLPIEDIDLLVVDKIGKNYSGTGMDTNIIGRMRILGIEEPRAPRIKYILASGLSEECHGNALGIGLADLTTRKLFDQIDFQTMNENVVTSTFLQRAMIPIVMNNDREAVSAALRCNWGTSPQEARIMRIASTLHLEYLYVSESLLPELSGVESIEIISKPDEMIFDENGYFTAMHG